MKRLLWYPARLLWWLCQTPHEHVPYAPGARRRDEWDSPLCPVAGRRQADCVGCMLPRLFLFVSAPIWGPFYVVIGLPIKTACAVYDFGSQPLPKPDPVGGALTLQDKGGELSKET